MFNNPSGDGWPFGTAKTAGNGPVAGVNTYGAIRAWQYINYQGSHSGNSSGLMATVDSTGAGAASKQPYLETKIWLPAPVIGQNTLALNISCGSDGTAPPYDSKDTGSPQGKSGLSPAVVLQSNDFVGQNGSTISTEIDLFEAYSVAYATKYTLSKKIWKSGAIIGGTPIQTISYPYADGVGAWHTYGCLVQTDYVHYYLDGVEVFKTTTDPSDLLPLYLYIDLAIGGSWPVDLSFGTVNQGTVSSITYNMLIAYVLVSANPALQ